MPVWSNAIKVDNIIKFNELGVGQMYPGVGWNGFWLRPNRLSWVSTKLIDYTLLHTKEK